MQTIAAADFKRQCLAILDDLGTDGVMITKLGSPVAKLLPVAPRGDPREFIGILKGKAATLGDVESPVSGWDPTEEWPDAQS